jgi:site-specific DNA-methyltransferase (adenine-specific)
VPIHQPDHGFQLQFGPGSGKLGLDPFCGSGQACIAALKTKRHYIGYEIEEEYVKLAERRISPYKQQLVLPFWTQRSEIDPSNG